MIQYFKSPLFEFSLCSGTASSPNLPSQSHDNKQFNNNCRVLILGSFDAAVVVVVVVKLDRVVEIPRFQKLVSCATEKNYVADLKEQDWDV